MLREIKIDQLSKLKKGDIFMTKDDMQLVNPSYYEFIGIDGESVEYYSLDSYLKRNSARVWTTISAFSLFVKYDGLFIIKKIEEEI